MSISLIYAADKNNGIGFENKLLFKIPQDMEWFKLQTIGKPIVFGRKTFESIGRPLPDRTNIILTRDTSFEQEFLITANSVEEVVGAIPAATEGMIIGGAEIYEQFLPWAKRIYRTVIHAEAEADTFFSFDESEWEKIYSYDAITDESCPDITFEIWERPTCQTK